MQPILPRRKKNMKATRKKHIQQISLLMHGLVKNNKGEEVPTLDYLFFCWRFFRRVRFSRLFLMDVSSFNLLSYALIKLTGCFPKT